MQLNEMVHKRTADVIFLLDYIESKYGYDDAKEALEQIVEQDPAIWEIWQFVQQNRVQE